MTSADAYKPKLYLRRWFIILSLFSITNLNCVMLQMTYAAIQDVILKYYNFSETDTWKVNMMSLVYMIAYLPATLVASVVLQKKGLRFSVTLGSLLNFIGSWIRLAAFHRTQDARTSSMLFWIAFGGQTIAAIGQPFIVNCVTQCSVNWFGEKERALATAIASFFNMLGSAVAFGLAPLLAGNGSEVGMVSYLGAQALFCSFTLVAIVALFTERPPTPPSSSEYEKWKVRKLDQTGINQRKTDRAAVSDESPGLLTVYKSVVTNWNFLLLIVAFSAGYSVLVSFTSLINQIVVPKGYSADDAGIFGVIIIGSGLLGALFYSVLADFTKRYKSLVIIAGSIALCGFVWFCIVIMFERTTPNFVMCCLASALLGCNAVPVVPLILEIGVELTFPHPENIANGLILGISTIASVTVMVAMNALQKTSPDPQHPGKYILVSMQNALWLGIALFTLCIFLLLWLRPKYLRYEYERELKEQQKDTSETSKILE